MLACEFEFFDFEFYQACICLYYTNHYIISDWLLEMSDILLANEDLAVPTFQTGSKRDTIIHQHYR